MGFCHSSRGRFTVETRRESFIVHADYRDSLLDDVWSSTPHPEFKNEDWNDLINALRDAMPKSSPPDPRWRQDNPRDQMVSVLQSARDWTSNALEGRTPPERALPRILEDIKELLRLAEIIKIQTYWPEKE